MLQADFQGAMHGQLQGWFLEVLKGALQEAYSFNRRVPVFQIAKKKWKRHNTTKIIMTPTSLPPPFGKPSPSHSDPTRFIIKLFLKTNGKSWGKCWNSHPNILWILSWPLYRIIIFYLSDESNKLYPYFSSFQNLVLFFMNLLTAGLFSVYIKRKIRGDTFMSTKTELRYCIFCVGKAS